jgi:hypothetical protein
VAEVIVALVKCSIPVVAALQGENSINALLLATACDVIVCSRQASHTFKAKSLSEAMQCLMKERLGHQTADRLFSLLQPLTSAQLRQAGVVVSIVEKIDLDDEALQIARDIAQGSLVALLALKRHLNQTMRLISQSLIDPSQLTRLHQLEKECVEGGMLAVDVNNMGEYEYAESKGTEGLELSYKSDRDNAVPVPVELDSKVVRLEKYANGVAVMNLCDLESKNTFTSEFGSTLAHCHLPRDTPLLEGKNKGQLSFNWLFSNCRMGQYRNAYRANPEDHSTALTRTASPISAGLSSGTNTRTTAANATKI